MPLRIAAPVDRRRSLHEVLGAASMTTMVVITTFLLSADQLADRREQDGKRLRARLTGGSTPVEGALSGDVLRSDRRETS